MLELALGGMPIYKERYRIILHKWKNSSRDLASFIQYEARKIGYFPAKYGNVIYCKDQSESVDIREKELFKLLERIYD
jgi:hypothetical protein